jgi:alpha-mannosidase
LAITLLRGFSSTVGTAGEEGAQSLGSHCVEFAVVPFSGPVHMAGLNAIAASLRAPVLAAVTGLHPGPLTVPARLLVIEPAMLVLDALEQTEDGEALLVRLHNPAPESCQARVKIDALGTRACRSELDESAGDSLPVEGGWITLDVRAKQIVTLRVS